MGIAFAANAFKANADWGGLLSFDWGKKEEPGARIYFNEDNVNLPFNTHTHSGNDWMRRKYDVEPTWKRFENAEK